jgi:hypothetical protein
LFIRIPFPEKSRKPNRASDFRRDTLAISGLLQAKTADFRDFDLKCGCGATKTPAKVAGVSGIKRFLAFEG